GWTVEAELARRIPGRLVGATTPARLGTAHAQPSERQTTKTDGRRRPPNRPPALSKDAYRRRRQLVEDDLTRLGLRKSQLELALRDPQVHSNFVELRRVTSELADVDQALSQAEDAWLALAEQAPR
ncbi:MAG: ABC transporter C-terminal domain-containing protein, partial [Chloroflexota bacterium]|nr:ABC transporter C-terminal domain-containing protein [Chloroflexota bacterium]